MAFAFFRRRQKMVIIIMAVLMVSFLIGFQGFNTLFSRSGGKQPIGETKYGKIKLIDLTSASDQLDMLSQNAYLGYFATLESLAYRVVISNVDQDGRNSAPLVYAMLLQEAKERGEDVTEDDVDRYFNSLPYPYLPVKNYKDLIDRLNTQGRITEKQLRGAVANWIRVYRLFEDSCPTTPPSEPRLQRVYRDLNEKIALQIVKFPAADFVKDVPEPTPEQINEQFNKYRGVIEGSYPDETSFGFGYYQLPKVRISWFMVRPSVVARVVKVSDEDVQKYYRRNKANFVKKVPVETATTQNSDEATSKPVEYKTVQIDINEAWDGIVAELRVDAVTNRVNKIISSVEKDAGKLAGNAGKTAEDADSVYEKIFKSMRMDAAAAEALSKRIESLSVKNETLENAMNLLAEKASLAGICFPWGTYDGVTIDPQMEISFTANGETLGDVLKNITKQVFSQAKTEEGEAPVEAPDLQWSMVKGFEGVLFPLDTDDLKMFPIAAAKTALLTGSELWQDQVLGLCGDPTSKEGQFLAPTAFSRDAVEATRDGGVYVGPRMQTPLGEQVLWRIIETSPEHAPASITDVAGLRDKVIEDLKLTAAYQTAIKKADEFKELAASIGVEEAARKAKLEGVKTDLFARLGQRGWTDIEGLELPTRADLAKKTLVEQVFKLAPANPEPPYPTEPPAVMVLYIPALRATAVVQRVDYQPAYENKYEADRRELADMLMRSEKSSAIQYWFSRSTVTERLDYEPEKK